MKVEASEALEVFQKRPDLFFTEVLGVDSLEAYQRRILDVIATHDRIAISACHDVGKSWTLARVVLWFVTCFPYCKVITTAPTYNQVKNILWSEIRAAYARSKYPLGGKINLTEWQVTKEGDWFAIGFTPRNELSGESGQGTQSSFQGFHAPYVLVVFDEATGVPYPIWTMAEGLLTSANTKFICIGNPTSRASEFFKCFSSPDWSKVNLDCFDSPNLQANGVTKIEDLIKEIDVVRSLSDEDAQARLRSYKAPKPYLLSLQWVVSKGLPRNWGITHPLFVSKVLGKFPEDTPDTLIPLGVVAEAQLRVSWPGEGARKTIGVDVARFGSDATILTALHDRKYLGRKPLMKKDTAQVTGAVIDFARELGGADIIVIDETGIGGGVVDMLREAQKDDTLPRNTEIRGVQFGAACEDDENKAKYVNLKARMFGLLRDDLKAADGLQLGMEDVYLDELPTIRYYFDSKGRMAIESKDEYKKRTGRKSPDDSDSLALANYGRYDEMTVGRFAGDADNTGYSKPFAASLGDRRRW
jgi:phage terminase large subunit